MRSGHGFDRSGSCPDWWPEGERWPPQREFGSAAWADFGRVFFRRAATAAVGLIVLPLVVGVVLAVAIGGWESVGVAVVLGGSLIILFLFGARVLIGAFGPVRSLVNATGRLADGDTSARMAATGNRAMMPAVVSFNRMAERLELAEEQRRQLIADVGHELRTPLTVLRGEIEAFVDGVHEPDEARLQELLQDVAVMERLLTDLQTLSTSDAGVLALHREPTDLVDLSRSVVHNFETSSPRVRFVHDLEHVDANVDPVRVREVLTNLINNAIRATGGPGSVTVRVFADESAQRSAIIEVIDDGKGIDPDRIDAVFTRFEKGPESNGSGLGLTITKSLVEAHGGAIEIESDIDAGTHVTVRLPTVMKTVG